MTDWTTDPGAFAGPGIVAITGAPGMIRTCDTRFRRAVIATMRPCENALTCEDAGKVMTWRDR